MQPPEPRDRQKFGFADDEHPRFDRGPHQFCREDHSQTRNPVTFRQPVDGQQFEWDQYQQWQKKNDDRRVGGKFANGRFDLSHPRKNRDLRGQPFEPLP